MKAILAALLLLPLLAQDVESKKARVGEILKAIAQAKPEAGGDKAKEAVAQRKLMPQLEELRKLIPEIAGPDPEKQSALFQELMEKYIPEEAAGQRMASNQRNASAALMSIGTAQAEFRAYDPDGDGTANFWVADISGLHRIRAKNGKAAALIEDQVARADARPALPVDAAGKLPKAESVYFHRGGAAGPYVGYSFVALAGYEGADGKTVPYDTGDGRNAAKYGICAYPAEYGKTGKLTFIKNESLNPHMWKKDTGGKPPGAFPADPGKEGWEPYD
jgi:hypothetical protein